MRNKTVLQLIIRILTPICLFIFTLPLKAQEDTIPLNTCTQQTSNCDEVPSSHTSESINSSAIFSLAQDSITITESIPAIISNNNDSINIISKDGYGEISETDIFSENINNNTINTGKKKPLNIYEQPYSLWGNYPNYGALLGNTGLFFGAAIGAAAILYVLPESFSNWDREEIRKDGFGNWWKNVKAGPVIDHDDWVLNYVAHPYVGSIYYMSARSAGFNAGYSLLYAFGMSTVFWEYGVEAFAEVPSVQDLIVTPIGGAIIGEGFYILKRKILSDNYYLLNSKFLGHTVAFLIDPVTEVKGIFRKNPKNESNNDLSFSSQPMVLPTGKLGYSINLSLRF